jgi:phytoene synthase
MIDGWEALLDEPLDADAIERFAVQRGGTLFTAAGALLGGERSGLREAGAGWALADLAANLRDAGLRANAREMARPRLDDAMASRWPVRLRALGALVLLAREGVPGSPARVARLLWHRATGL